MAYREGSALGPPIEILRLSTNLLSQTTTEHEAVQAFLKALDRVGCMFTNFLNMKLHVLREGTIDVNSVGDRLMIENHDYMVRRN